MINVCIDVSYLCVILYNFIEYAMKRNKWRKKLRAINIKNTLNPGCKRIQDSGK